MSSEPKVPPRAGTAGEALEAREALDAADPWSALRRFTPARIALGRAGAALPTRAVLEFGLAHARARDAVHCRLDVDALATELQALGCETRSVHSRARDRTEYLTRPDYGRRLDEDSAAQLRARSPGAPIVLAVEDGLSAVAVQRHAPALIAALRALAPERWAAAPVVIAEQGRVALGDEIGECLNARLVLVLIGERPGLSSPDSLGAYLTFAPRVGRTDAERNCVSNIRPEGLPVAAAAARLDWLVQAALTRQLSGVGLKDDSPVIGAATETALAPGDATVPDAALGKEATAMQTPTMNSPEALQALRAQLAAMPLELWDLSKGYLFEQDLIELYFERLRREDPVHLSRSKRYGEYWSVTTYRHIVEVEQKHQIFSSESTLGGIALAERPPEEMFPSFIAMDEPRHTAQRKTVAPMLTPGHLATMEATIRGHAAEILDGLPVGETFDWVRRVSIELTTRMLAMLFDFPFEQRSKLTWWSDMATGDPDGNGAVTSWEQRMAELEECRDVFQRLWNERIAGEPRHDLISMMAHSAATRDMDPRAFLGNLLLLIVGGNDTTRNSISGGLLALHRHPEQYAKLRARPELVESLVPEIIRWQTPLAHMRRTAVADYELGGKQIRAGEKVVLWYLSANRDEQAIERPHEFLIDREHPKRHLSFGFGIHHCVGNRLAELQLKILWEEILKRYPVIEVVGEPVRTRSNFVHGFLSMPVRIPARHA